MDTVHQKKYISFGYIEVALHDHQHVQFVGMTSTGLAWYINGYLTPELWLRRGLTYAFKVYGGNNPHSADTYHPFIVTDEPHGGFDRLSEDAQKKVRVLAGVEFTRRGQPRPTAGR